MGLISITVTIRDGVRGCFGLGFAGFFVLFFGIQSFHRYHFLCARDILISGPCSHRVYVPEEDRDD